VAVVLVAAFPLLIRNPYHLFLAASVALYLLVAIGMNVLAGFTGQFSIAHAALVGVGAYTVANLTVMHGWPFWAALVPAAVLPAVVGAILTLPSLWLTRWYFAMISILVAALIEQFFLEAENLTGGGSGIAGVPQISIGGWVLSSRALLYLFLAVDAVLLLASRNLLRSPWGRAMMAVRDSEIAARASGVSVPVVKLLAFTLSAMVAGLMGAFYASLTGAVAPDLFSLDLGIFILLMVVVGGAGLVESPVLGALALFAIPTLLLDLARYRLFVYAGLLLVTMALAPTGIGGGLRAAAARVRAWRAERAPSPAAVPIAGGATPPGDHGAPAAPDLQAAPAASGLLPERAGRRAGDGMTLRDVSISFGGIRALREVTMEIGGGSIHGVIGPNGSGKTTLLNVLSGFYPPGSGRIVIGDRDVTRWGPTRVARAGVARSFQQPKVLPEETVLDNVMLGAFARRRAGLPEWLTRAGRARGEDRALRSRALELLAFVGLDNQADQAAALLPHGQLRLVEIARALLAEPSVLLLDEPAAGLSPGDLERLDAVIRALHDADMTIVLVEHHMDFLTAIAEDITVMNVGQVLARGTAAEVLRRPEVIEAYLGMVANAL
jgi:ABC-type branched-subunit amino acid transport system ATPase component/ABC-type branched-subunit amino acid transport system permease subunit